MESQFGGYDYLPKNPHNVDADSVLIDAEEGEKATVVHDNQVYVGVVQLNKFSRKSIIVQIEGGGNDGAWIRINW